MTDNMTPELTLTPNEDAAPAPAADEDAAPEAPATARTAEEAEDGETVTFDD